MNTYVEIVKKFSGSLGAWYVHVVYVYSEITGTACRVLN